MRILITGSRDWVDVTFVEDKLASFTENIESASITLVSGHCLTGADAIAEAFAKQLGWQVERHPADWSRYGKQAGFVRNDYMVKLGADLCLAFIKDNSKGATMSATLAEKVNIPTVRFDNKTPQDKLGEDQ